MQRAITKEASIKQSHSFDLNFPGRIEGDSGVPINEPMKFGFMPDGRSNNLIHPKVRLHATFESKTFFFEKVIAKDMAFQT